MKNTFYLFVLSLLMVGCSGDSDGSETAVANYEITDIIPRKAYTGDVITIQGSNFMAAQSLVISVDNVALLIETKTDTEIAARIPVGANTGTINATVNQVTREFGNFVIFEEKDFFRARFQDGNCRSSQIYGLTADTMEKTDWIFSFPQNCVSIDKVLFAKESNTLVYSYTYQLPGNGGEARKAIVRNLGTNEQHQIILSEGPGEMHPKKLLCVSRDKLFYDEFFSENGPGLTNHRVHRYHFAFHEAETFFQFTAEGDAHVTATFNDVDRTIIVYRRNLGDSQGLFSKILTTFPYNSLTYFVDENIKEIVVDDQGRAFALELIGGSNWELTRIRADTGAHLESLSSIETSEVGGLFYSRSTNRLFARINDGNPQLYKFPLGIGEPSTIDLDDSISSLYVHN